MGLSDFLQSAGGRKQFVTESRFEETVEKQIKAVPEILERLRHLEDVPSESLRLEFFFYTNAAVKAKEFSSYLKKRGYSVEYGKAAGISDLFLITGWTTKISMTEESVFVWSKEMCESGYEYDCDFDGWGTTPDQ
ncbi:MAG TPA: ribonuclease E inhibitor RraB [Bacteroidia bacterium]|nr:ribonuclease E inhibitor RraB [Bacteroidia bacterium]